MAGAAAEGEEADLLTMDVARVLLALEEEDEDENPAAMYMNLAPLMPGLL